MNDKIIPTCTWKKNVGGYLPGCTHDGTHQILFHFLHGDTHVEPPEGPYCSTHASIALRVAKDAGKHAIMGRIVGRLARPEVTDPIGAADKDVTDRWRALYDELEDLYPEVVPAHGSASLAVNLVELLVADRAALRDALDDKQHASGLRDATNDVERLTIENEKLRGQHGEQIAGPDAVYMLARYDEIQKRLAALYPNSHLAPPQGVERLIKEREEAGDALAKMTADVVHVNWAAVADALEMDVPVDPTLPAARERLQVRALERVIKERDEAIIQRDLARDGSHHEAHLKAIIARLKEDGAKEPTSILGELERIIKERDEARSAAAKDVVDWHVGCERVKKERDHALDRVRLLETHLHEVEATAEKIHEAVQKIEEIQKSLDLVRLGRARAPQKTDDELKAEIVKLASGFAPNQRLRDLDESPGTAQTEAPTSTWTWFSAPTNLVSHPIDQGILAVRTDGSIAVMPEDDYYHGTIAPKCALEIAVAIYAALTTKVEPPADANLRERCLWYLRRAERAELERDLARSRVERRDQEIERAHKALDAEREAREHAIGQYSARWSVAEKERDEARANVAYLRGRLKIARGVVGALQYIGFTKDQNPFSDEFNRRLVNARGGRDADLALRELQDAFAAYDALEWPT